MIAHARLGLGLGLEPALDLVWGEEGGGVLPRFCSDMIRFFLFLAPAIISANEELLVIYSRVEKLAS